MAEQNPAQEHTFGALNNVSRPNIRKRYDPQTGTAMEAMAEAANESYSSDVFKNVGSFKAICLRVEDNSTEIEPGTGGLLDYFATKCVEPPKFVAIKARIPEVHSMLPIPHELGWGDGPHQQVIDMYPTFIAQSVGVEAPIEGALVWVDYTNRSNWTGPFYIKPVIDGGPDVGTSTGSPTPAGAFVNCSGAPPATEQGDVSSASSNASNGSQLQSMQHGQSSSSSTTAAHTDPAALADWTKAAATLPSGVTRIWQSPHNGRKDNDHEYGKRTTLIWHPNTTNFNQDWELIYWFHGLDGFSWRSFEERVVPQLKELVDAGRNFVFVKPELPWSKRGSGSKRGPRQKGAWQTNKTWGGDFAAFDVEVKSKFPSAPSFVSIYGQNAGGSAIARAALEGSLTAVSPNRIFFADADYGWGYSYTPWVDVLAESRAQGLIKEGGPDLRGFVPSEGPQPLGIDEWAPREGHEKVSLLGTGFVPVWSEETEDAYMQYATTIKNLLANPAPHAQQGAVLTTWKNYVKDNPSVWLTLLTSDHTPHKLATKFFNNTNVIIAEGRPVYHIELEGLGRKWAGNNALLVTSDEHTGPLPPMLESALVAWPEPKLMHHPIHTASTWLQYGENFVPSEIAHQDVWTDAKIEGTWVGSRLTQLPTGPGLHNPAPVVDVAGEACVGHNGKKWRQRNVPNAADQFQPPGAEGSNENESSGGDTWSTNSVSQKGIVSPGRTPPDMRWADTKGGWRKKEYGIPKDRRPPGGRGSGEEAIFSACHKTGLPPEFAYTMVALSWNETGCRLALPAIAYYNPPVREGGRRKVSAWGIFQWQDAHAQKNFGFKHPWMMSEQQEVEGPINNRYVGKFRTFRDMNVGINGMGYSKWKNNKYSSTGTPGKLFYHAGPFGVFLWHISVKWYNFMRKNKSMELSFLAKQPSAVSKLSGRHYSEGVAHYLYKYYQKVEQIEKRHQIWMDKNFTKKLASGGVSLL